MAVVVDHRDVDGVRRMLNWHLGEEVEGNVHFVDHLPHHVALGRRESPTGIRQQEELARRLALLKESREGPEHVRVFVSHDHEHLCL
jgi:hypothetical protein